MDFQLPNISLRLFLSLVRLALVLLVVWQSARLAFRPDPRAELRYLDGLFIAGRYHDALAAATALTISAPRFAPGWARLGMVRALRDEQPAASQALGYALGLGLSGRDHDLARLYEGQVAMAAGERDEAAQFWALVGAQSPLFPIRRALEAESLLAVQDYVGAEAAYRAALTPQLPRDWRVLAYARLAALRASSDPAGARAELAQVAAAPTAVSLPALDGFIRPLLPTRGPDPEQLAVVLGADPPRRAQLLGQIYLDAGWYALAETQFAAVAPDSPGGIAAATYAAYTRWRAGARAEGLRQLRALVIAHPDEPRARALLALAYLAAKDTSGAAAQLAVVRAMSPRAPDTHLAWAQWYTARHDYVAADDEYRRAFSDAPPDERGRYALALARFHLDTALQMCAVGHPAAEEAARQLPEDAGAWVVLAAARLACGDLNGAREAAARALVYNPNDAEAYYYLGRALAALGDQLGARRALIQAADLAPASPWRARAETQLASLGLSSSTGAKNG